MSRQLMLHYHYWCRTLILTTFIWRVVVVFFLEKKDKEKMNRNCDILATSRQDLSLGLPTRSDTSNAVRPQKMATCLKFRILEEEEL